VTVIINKQAYACSRTVLDLGYSDRLAQIININVNRSNREPIKSKKRQFTKGSVGEFNYPL
jgi:hypothetical protein